MTIGELWRFEDDRLVVRELNSAGGYAEIGISPNLPDLPLVEVQRFMDMRHGMGEIQWIRAFPQWVLENFPH